MKKPIWLNVVANLVIFVLVAGVAVIGFSENVSDAFNGEKGGAIYKGNSPNGVSLMINVYWGTEYLDEMLSTLNEHGAKCTFFVGGSWVADNPRMLEKFLESGHEIGNHGYFHKNQAKLDFDANLAEIATCHQAVKQLTGLEMTLFAPPSGAFSQETLRAARHVGYETIMWSKDTVDWRDKDAETVYKRATSGVKGGDLILMHPTPHTAAALERILVYYQQSGLTAITVSKNIRC